MKSIGYAISIMSFIAYVLFRLELNGIDMGNIYFIMSCVGFAYLSLHNSTKFKGLNYLFLIYISGFFISILGIFLWYWVVLNDPAIWVYRSLLIALPISFIINLITKNGTTTKH